MSRQSSHPGGGEAPVSLLKDAADELVYRPTAFERGLKATLWRALEGRPDLDAKALTLAQASDLTGSPSLPNRWSKPGFRPWLLNQDEFRIRLEAAADEALDALESIVRSDDPRATSARRAAARDILELAGRFPEKAGKGTSSSAIDGMDRAQLQAFLQKHAPKALGPISATVTSSTPSDTPSSEATPNDRDPEE